MCKIQGPVCLGHLNSNIHLAYNKEQISHKGPRGPQQRGTVAIATFATIVNPGSACHVLYDIAFYSNRRCF